MTDYSLARNSGKLILFNNNTIYLYISSKNSNIAVMSEILMNTRETSKALQLFPQQCCVASWKALLPVLPHL